MVSAVETGISAADGEVERVLEWRLDQFRRLGFPPPIAHVLTDSDVELAAARQLIARGCPPATAAAILL